jgi:hypothetical protein
MATTDPRQFRDPRPSEPPEYWNPEPDWHSIMRDVEQKLFRAGLKPSEFVVGDPYDVEINDKGEIRYPVEIVLFPGEY